MACIVGNMVVAHLMRNGPSYADEQKGFDLTGLTYRKDEEQI